MPKIIKSGQYSGILNEVPISELEHEEGSESSSLSDEILLEALNKSKEIIDKAQKYSDSLVEDKMQQLEQECEKIKEQSRKEGYYEGYVIGEKEGYEKGHSEGYQKGMQEVQKLIQDLQKVILEVNRYKDSLIEGREAEIAEFAWEVARKVLRTQQKQQPEYIIKLISSVLEDYRSENWIKLHVSKNTADLIKNCGDQELNNLLFSLKNFAIEPDLEMSDDECIIEIPEGFVDLGAETQFVNLKRALDA
ncbi:MAG TPA: hypothetical protein GXX17_07540 [Clostridiales bacterium]|nr:hypothetical protein [Clostridiales bacterium]